MEKMTHTKLLPAHLLSHCKLSPNIPWRRPYGGPEKQGVDPYGRRHKHLIRFSHSFHFMPLTLTGLVEGVDSRPSSAYRVSLATVWMQHWRNNNDCGRVEINEWHRKSETRSSHCGGTVRSGGGVGGGSTSSQREGREKDQSLSHRMVGHYRKKCE